MDLFVKKCSSFHRLVILLPFSSYYNFGSGVVSVLCSIVFSKNNKVAIHARPHVTRDATRLFTMHLSTLHEMTKFLEESASLKY